MSTKCTTHYIITRFKHNATVPTVFYNGQDAESDTRWSTHQAMVFESEEAANAVVHSLNLNQLDWEQVAY